MKKTILFVYLAGILLITGCPKSNNFIEAEISGDYTGSLSAEGELELYEGAIYHIKGHDDDSNTEIFFDAYGITSAETINLVEFSPYGCFTDSNTATPTDYRTHGDTTTPSGSLVIEHYTDEFIKGSFDFTAKIYDSTRTITAVGTFKIPIEEEEEEE